MLDNERFGKRLVKAGVITQDQLDEALHHQELQEGRLGEILVRLGYVSESTILQFLAAEFRTRYVSTERLARARIPQQVLDLLPVHLAERYNLIPVLYDAETSTLSIVTSEPQNEENLREVHMLTSVRELRVYVALQPAVQAAIRKHYRGEINAFKDLLYQNASPIPNLGGQGYVANDSYGDAYDTSGAPYTQQGDQAIHNYGAGYGTENPYGYNSGYGDASPYQYNTNDYDANHQYGYQPDTSYPGGGYGDVPGGYGDPAYQDDYDMDNEKTKLHVGPYNLSTYDQDTVYKSEAASADYSNIVPSEQPAEASPLDQVNILAMTRMLVGQLEALHPRYKQHLAKQRPLLQSILRGLDLQEKDATAIWLAFYLHHMELPEPHPTLLTMAADPEAKEKQRTAHKKFMRRIAHLRLPEETTEVLQHMYEQADGNGFPGNLLREETPLGARILAILDAFEELQFTHSSKSNAELVEILNKEQGVLFDSRLLGIFEKELERVENYERGTIPRILLLEPERENAKDLEKALWDRGFWVYATHHPGEAEEICQRESIDLMVLEVVLPGESDGFTLAEELRESLDPAPELIFLTSRNGQEELDRGIELARDYLIKPLSTNIIATKINGQIQRILKEKAGRKKSGNEQLAGSLEQMGLADLLQFLSQGRRTGRLTITFGREQGHIFLDQGAVVNATIKKEKGEPALFKMMAWEKGTFSLNPSITSEERLIHKSTDGLLLDMLRMLDEARRDGIEDPFASGEVDEETDFGGISFDDDDDEPEKKMPETSGAKGKGGLFGDIEDNDLDDMFSSFGGDASSDNLTGAKKP